MMNKTAKVFVVALFNAALFLVLLELFSLVYFWAVNGHIFYMMKPELASDAASPDDRDASGLTPFQVHPYFGVNVRPGYKENRKVRSNNFGFTSLFDYPFIRKNRQQYIIGIFGGSVGELFGRHGSATLIEELRKSPRYTRRKFVILNFARGGYKQPQQLNVLNYFLSIGQELDMVINIDGYNEVVLAGANERRGIDASMPSHLHIESLINIIDHSTLSPARLESLYRIMRYRGTIHKIERFYSANPLASAGLVAYHYHRHLSKRCKETISEMDASASTDLDTSMVFLRDSPQSLDDIDIVDKVTDVWVNASLLMHASCLANDIEYCQVIQPNQYYSGKVFTEEERSVAIDERAKNARLVQLGYPVLIEKSAVLRARGVDIFNAVHVFDQIDETIFIDSCCHFNQRGNRILARYIVGTLLSRDQ